MLKFNIYLIYLLNIFVFNFISGKISRNLRKKSPSLLNLFSAGDDDFRYRYCSDVISQISPTILAKKIHAELMEKTSYDFERFTSQESFQEKII